MNSLQKHSDQVEDKKNSIAIQLAVSNMQLLELLKFRLIDFNQLTTGIKDNVSIYFKQQKEAGLTDLKK